MLWAALTGAPLHFLASENQLLEIGKATMDREIAG
jgi:hypothetical protein